MNGQKAKESISKEVASLFKDLFVGRKDVFVEQYKRSNGNVSYRKVGRPITDNDIMDHLNGKKTYGSYLSSTDNTCHSMVFDFDIPKDVNHNDTAWAEVKNRVMKLKNTLIDLGIENSQIAIEFSGRRGFHIWLFVKENIPSFMAYSVAKFIVEKSGIQCEYFPKKKKKGKASYGNGIKLPMGINRATGKRCEFVDESFNPYPNQYEYISKIKKVSTEQIKEILSKNNIAKEKQVVLTELDTDLDMHFDLHKKGASLERLINECKAISDIVKKAEKEKHLVHSERLAVANIFTLFGKEGEREIHKIIGYCKDYSQERTQNEIEYRKDKKYKPMTCSKFQDLNICVHNCNLKPKSGQNASPIQLAFGDPSQNKVLEVKMRRGIKLIIQNYSEHKGDISGKLELTHKKDIIYADKVNLSSGRSRTHFVKKCIKMAGKTPIDEKAMEKHLIESEKNIRQKLSEAVKPSDAGIKKYEMSQEEKEEAMAFLKNPNIFEEIEKDAEILGIVGEKINVLLIYIVCTSRKLQKPLAIVIKAESSSGKSYIITVTLSMMPPEELKAISRATTNAFFYFRHDLEHFIVYIAEKSGAENADYSIRTLLSEGMLTLLVPIKNPDTGMIETKEMEMKGPVAYIETTTKPVGNYENETRVLILSVDESESQTKKIHEAQRNAKTLEGLKRNMTHEAIRRKHQNAQRLLQTETTVAIPYADKIDFPTHSVRTRRDNLKFLCLIEAVAFLRQYQKEVKKDGEIVYVEADVYDYDIAYKLGEVAFAQSINEVSKKSRDLMIIIREMVKQRQSNAQPVLSEEDAKEIIGEITFTRADVRKYVKGWSDAAIHSCMKELADYELLKVHEGGQGKAYVYSLMPEDEGAMQNSCNLMTPEELRRAMGF